MTDHEHECTHYRTAGEGWEETIVCSVCFTPPPLDEQVAVLNEHAALKRENEILLGWGTFLYGMDDEDWPEGAYEYYQKILSHDAASKMNDALADTQEQLTKDR